MELLLWMMYSTHNLNKFRINTRITHHFQANQLGLVHHQGLFQILPLVQELQEVACL
jgi:hypothetical protein